MKQQGRKPSYRLTFDDAVEVWLRYWDGEIQHRIAAAFDVNAARVSEVLKEHKFVGSKKVAQAKYKPKAA